jgi:hypothetical protein
MRLKVKPMPDTSTPTGIMPWDTSQPPHAYSISSDRWMASRLVASNEALAAPNWRPAANEATTSDWKRSRSSASPVA